MKTLPLFNRSQSRLRVLLGLVLLLAAVAQAGAGYVATPHQSRWSAVSAAHGCHLAHEIPRFATVLISQVADERLVFSLYLHRPLTESRRGELRVEHPHWKEGDDEHLSDVVLESGRRAISLGHYDTQHLLTRLEQGRQPTLELVGWYSAEPVNVAISPVAFRAAYRDFLACKEHRAANGSTPPGEAGAAAGHEEAGALPAWLQQGQETASLDTPDEDGVPLPEAPQSTVYFAFDDDGLTRTAKDRLAAFARQADDPHLQVIVSTGHTDSTGDAEYNERLGTRRAEAVKAELQRLGVSEDRVQVRSEGQRAPLMDEDDVYGEAANRRVEVHTEY